MTYLKNIFSIISIFLVFNIQGQNILGINQVNNPSFEDFYTCPTYSAQLYFCKYWWGFSSDYFNACAPLITVVSVPTNGAGSHFPHTGNAYVGFSIYCNANPNLDYRETIKTKLKDTLIQNKRYCTNFYLTLAQYSYTYILSNYIFLDSIGILITKDSIQDDVLPVLNTGIKVQNKIFNLDTINWIKISNSFVANEGNRYLIIGNFNNIITWPPGKIGTTYVYLDDVSVCECSFEFNLGKDTTLCEGETLLLNPNMPNAIYTWQDSSHAATYKVTKTGSYWVRAYFPDYGITTSSSINVTFNGDCIKNTKHLYS